MPTPHSGETAPKIERNMTIVTLLEEGMHPSEIARQFNISRSRVYQIRYEYENGHRYGQEA